MLPPASLVSRQKPGSHVLYLGAASGTTVSHVSDLVGPVSEKYSIHVRHYVCGVLFSTKCHDHDNLSYTSGLSQRASQQIKCYDAMFRDILSDAEPGTGHAIRAVSLVLGFVWR